MTFEALVDRLMSLYDVTQQRAVDVVNERLQRMVTESESLRSIVTIGTTTAGTTSYSLPSTVVNVIKARIGTQTYEGSETLEDFWEIDAGQADTDGFFYVLEPDTDSDENTANIRFYPSPSTSGQSITALAAIQPSTLTYTSNTTLPIPLDTHEHLLAGAKAELLNEDDREDESPVLEQVFAQGIAKLSKRVEARAKGSGSHRMRLAGYDFNQHPSIFDGTSTNL